jgi:cysteine-rich repeat protein
VVSPEICDDGTAGSDGCNAQCTGNSPGYICAAGSPTLASVCIETCGDGIKTISEICDDGINVGEGCLNGCGGVSIAWSCTTLTNQLSVCSPIPGDGLVVGSEECDDNNTISDDGCSSAMTKETGWTFSSGNFKTCTEIAQDGLV